MRLRTLPLSLSGIIIGTAIAASNFSLNPATVAFLILTTALLQVLSNLSNELGDTLHGTDTAEGRQGMHYSLMDGAMTIEEMKRLISWVKWACYVSGLIMILFSFKGNYGIVAGMFLLLGAAAVKAAMHYTLGENPYGYRGKGDYYVFIFFGLVSTCGGYYICCHDITNLLILLPACAVGLFSVGVLNVNNIRDMKTDAATRTTVALKLGARKARIYQTCLILGGWVLMIAYSAIEATRWTEWIYLTALPLFILHLKGVYTREDRALDPMLPMLVMSTFLMSVLFTVGLLISSK